MAQWVSDVQQWSAGAMTNKIEKNIEEFYLSIKQHKYYLYRQSAGNRSRAKQRQKIAQEKRKLEIALSEYNQTHVSQLPDANSILSEDHYSWPWECHGICGNKKRTFDKIMLLTRLQEEKVILVSEIKRHYEFLKNAAVTLEELSQTSAEDLEDCPESTHAGLISAVKKRLHQIKSTEKAARKIYSDVLGGQSMLLEEEEEQEEDEEEGEDSTRHGCQVGSHKHLY